MMACLLSVWRVPTFDQVITLHKTSHVSHDMLQVRSAHGALRQRVMQFSSLANINHDHRPAGEKVLCLKLLNRAPIKDIYK